VSELNKNEVPDKITLTREQSERFATDWLKGKLNDLKEIVDEIESKLE